MTWKTAVGKSSGVGTQYFKSECKIGIVRKNNSRFPVACKIGNWTQRTGYNT